MVAHANVARVRAAAQARLSPALSAEDSAALEDLLHPDVIWYGAPSGADVKGREQVVEQWNAYARGEHGAPRLEVRRVYADGLHAVVEAEVRATTDVGVLSPLQATVLELDADGKATGIWGLPSDAELVTGFARSALPEDHRHLPLFRVAEAVRNRQTFEPDDIATLERFLDEHVIWHGAGRSQFKDGARERENVIALYKMFKGLTGGTFAMDYSGMFADDVHAVSFVKLTGDVGELRMDFNEVNLFHLKPDGGTYEFWGIAEDQDEVDDFWASYTW